MNDKLLGLPLEIVSEDDKTYTIDIWRPTTPMLEETWERYQQYRVMFSDVTLNDYEHFLSIVMVPGTIILSVEVEDKEIGLIYFTEISQATSAFGHYIFWDRKSGAGRHRVLLTAQRTIMKEFGLHRMDMAVPIFAFSALHRLHKIGYRIEGRRKEALLYKGRWADLLLFGVLFEELTDEAIEQAHLEATDEQHTWHGLLKQDDLLAAKILRGRRKKDGNGTRNKSTADDGLISAGVVEEVT
jgi:RimJ/RimL family protein N-acetyltransferase